MDGIILINKEKKYTSHDVVAKVKKILKVKVGHTGTLDPNATGILPLLLGNATKISKYLINHNKEYIAELKLGVKTDTADGEGKVIAEKQVNLEEIFENINESIQQILNSFVGKTLQKPPMYSAIKVNGKKLYEYARKNEKVEVKSRQIEIYKMELIKLDLKENIIKFKVRCSKGTYIRTLCEDIAEKLNTYGYMKELQRTEVGDFKIENAITIGELEELVNENIRFSPVLVIGPEGEQLGTMSRREAIEKAYEMGLDLYCVAPNAQPPVCKILDYGKFHFAEQKKAREAKKKQHVTEVKPLRLSPVIDQHDFETKLKQAKKWIEDGQKVKIDMRFRGRMITRKEVGEQVMNKFIEEISDIAGVDKAPSMEGNTMSVVLSPKKK